METALKTSLEELDAQDRSKIAVDENTGCWIWTASRDKHGYGHARRYGKTMRAHRYVYELFRGPIVSNVNSIDHLCRNPPCVNPAHMEPCTPKENVRRGLSTVVAPLPQDLVETVLALVETAYKRGVHDGLCQALAKTGPLE